MSLFGPKGGQTGNLDGMRVQVKTPIEALAGESG
jgi:hypothetical protein